MVKKKKPKPDDKFTLSLIALVSIVAIVGIIALIFYGMNNMRYDVIGEAALSCSDPDNIEANGYFMKGSVTIGRSSQTDKCLSNVELQEWKCADGGGFDKESIICPQGCVNGRCVACDERILNSRCIDGRLDTEYKTHFCTTEWRFNKTCSAGCNDAGTACTCFVEPVGNFRCSEVIEAVEGEYFREDCSTEWRVHELCDYGCEDSVCLPEPTGSCTPGWKIKDFEVYQNDDCSYDFDTAS